MFVLSTHIFFRVKFSCGSMFPYQIHDTAEIESKLLLTLRAIAILRLRLVGIPLNLILDHDKIVKCRRKQLMLFARHAYRH